MELLNMVKGTPLVPVIFGLKSRRKILPFRKNRKAKKIALDRGRFSITQISRKDSFREVFQLLIALVYLSLAFCPAGMLSKISVNILGKLEIAQICSFVKTGRGCQLVSGGVDHEDIVTCS